MKFSINKSKLPSFSNQAWEVITLELDRFDDESAWEIDWDGEITLYEKKNACWIIDPSEITSKQQSEIDDYIAANQAAIDKKADDESYSNRADYEYSKYLEERGM